MPVPSIQPPNYGSAVNSLIAADQAGARKRKLEAETNYLNNPTVVAAENALNNAKADAKEQEKKKSQQEVAIKSYKLYREKIQATKASVDVGDVGAHTKLQEYLKKINFPSVVPDLEVFYTEKTTVDSNGKATTTKVFDNDLYNKWYSASIQTTDDASKAILEGKKLNGKMENVYNGDRAMQVYVPKGKKYDPETELGKGWSFDKKEKPKEVFKKVYENGKAVWKEQSKIGGMETVDNMPKKETGEKTEDRKVKFEESMLKADEELTKGRTFTDKKGKEGEYNLLPDKVEGKKYADKFNRSAKRAGLTERYKWVESKEEIPADKLAQILPFGSDGKARTEIVGAWTKVDKGKEKTTTTKKNSSKEEIEAMKSGDIFWVDGKQYRRK